MDIVPSRDSDNLARLGHALTRLEAKLRTEAGPVETRINGGFLAAMPMMLNLTTKYGDVDVTFTPAGPRIDYADWDERERAQGQRRPRMRGFGRSSGGQLGM